NGVARVAVEHARDESVGSIRGECRERSGEGPQIDGILDDIHREPVARKSPVGQALDEWVGEDRLIDWDDRVPELLGEFRGLFRHEGKTPYSIEQWGGVPRIPDHCPESIGR